MFDVTSLVPESAEDSPSGASLRGPHRLAAIDSCERMWALRYFWFYRLKKDNPWRLGGTLIHTCYQYLFGSFMEKKPEWYGKQSLEQKLHEQVKSQPEPLRTQLLQMALSNLHEFMRFYPSDKDYIRPLFIEEEFMATLEEVDPITDEELETASPSERERLLWLKQFDRDVVTCRSDLVYESVQERNIWIMDYKSHGRSKINLRTGRLTKWRDDGEYALNFQVLMNLLIVRARLGAGVRGFVIQRTTRQEPYDFDRPVLTIPVMAYKEAGRTARELVAHEYQVMDRITQGGRPSPRYHACYGRYGECDYRYACLATTKVEMLNRLHNGDYSIAPPEEIERARGRLRVVQ